MSPQTSVLTDFVIGKEGAIGSLENRIILSKAVEVVAGVKPGRFVMKGTSDRQAVLIDNSILLGVTPMFNPGLILGASVLIPGREPGGADGEYLDEETMPVMRKGLIWMLAETVVAFGDKVFARHSAVGEIGRVRNDADTATAAVVSGSFFRGTTTAVDSLVLVEINMPTAIPLA